MQEGSASASAGSSSHTKGAAIRSFFVWYHQHHGPERLVRALAAVPAAARHQLDAGIEGLGVLPSTWYPDDLVHQLVDHMIAGLSAEEQEALAREGSKAAMSDTLRGVYKVLVSLFVDPARLAKHVGKLWSAYHDSGALAATVLGPRRHEVSLVDWRGHHPFVCMMNRAAMETIYGQIGCKKAVAREKTCVASGGDACVMLIEWT
jgi:hypothetical protein